MNIRVAQLNPIVGDIDGNKQIIINALRLAENDQIDLLILPELGLLGYPPMDLLERETFRDYVYKVNEEIIALTKETALVFGTITPNQKPTGRKMYNAAIMAYKGHKLAEVHKTLLPTYDVFDEYRYFEANDEWEPIDFKGIRFGLTICEDIWNNQNEYEYHLYSIAPAKKLKETGAQVLINISASPFTKRKPELRLKMLKGHVRDLKMPIFYANQVGANTEIIFDGDSTILNANGSLCERACMFEEDYIDARLNEADMSVEPVTNRQGSKMGSEERLFRASVLGLRDYVNKSKVARRVIIGLSGGIDSTLVAAIATEALGADRVMGVTMPSKFSSGGSITDSQLLAGNLGIEIHELAIKKIYDAYLDALDPLFKGTEFNVAEENIQSRARGVILMSISNKFGYMVLNTGNKSEMAVGYCTLYGDMAGGVSVISDIYKTEVYDISRWLNSDYYKKEVIPEAIINKAPSAELRPGQKDTDSLPEYDLLDGILKAYIEEQRSKREIISMGYDSELVEKIVRLVDLNEYKRRQAAPGFRVSPKAFGIGRRMPIVQKWTGHEHISHSNNTRL
jgi:NAD+ synthase (glutamine-hydrolysing)